MRGVPAAAVGTGRRRANASARAQGAAAPERQHDAGTDRFRDHGRQRDQRPAGAAVRRGGVRRRQDPAADAPEALRRHWRGHRGRLARRQVDVPGAGFHRSAGRMRARQRRRRACVREVRCAAREAGAAGRGDGGGEGADGPDLRHRPGLLRRADARRQVQRLRQQGGSLPDRRAGRPDLPYADREAADDQHSRLRR